MISSLMRLPLKFLCLICGIFLFKGCSAVWSYLELDGRISTRSPAVSGISVVVLLLAADELVEA